jgi:hypothetical protein
VDVSCGLIAVIGICDLPALKPTLFAHTKGWPQRFKGYL